MNPNSRPLPRRTFLASAAAATTFTVLKPATVFGAAANSQLAIGLIGCGGRGGWIADLFASSGKYRFVAVADYFQDKIDAVGAKVGVEAAHRYPWLARLPASARGPSSTP